MIEATAINPATGRQYGIDPSKGIWDDEYFDRTYGNANRAERAQKQAQEELAAAPARQKAETDARFATNKAELEGFNTRFGEAAPKIIDQTSQKYNLGALLDQANGLNTRVANLGGNLVGEGAGGYASGAQVDKAIQTNYLPRAQTAMTNLQTGTQLAQTEQSQLFKPYEIESNLLNERLARETTAYTAQQESELDALLAKMQSGVQLSVAEIQKASALAVAEKSYQAALAQANASVKAAQIGQQFQTVEPQNTLVNTATGGFRRY